ncbi:MAG: thiamine phosphate synthase [Ruminococcus flavefaciens]|nr:thiamine phosphate synthase [Ruminococcus flavefaciens]
MTAKMQTDMAIKANCTWIEVDPTLLNDDELNYLIEQCRLNRTILTFCHDDLLLDKHRVHGIHLGAGDADPAKIREQFGGHPIIGIDADSNVALYPLKRADVDYVVLNGYPEAVDRSTISDLNKRQQEHGIIIPIVVGGRIMPQDIADIIAAGASGFNIDINSLSGPDYEQSLKEFIYTCDNIITQ